MNNTQIAEKLSNIAARVDIPDDIKAAVNETAEQLRSPIEYDLWIYRWVVIVLGVIAMITVLGGISIAIFFDGAGKNLPDAIVALGSAAVGALAGLLAPSPRN